MARTKHPPYYRVKRVYIVMCGHPDCEQSIGRPVSGEDPETQAEVDETIAEHDAAYHPKESRR